MDLSALSDHEKLILGLRFRLKHIRLAVADVEAGRMPEGFEFSPDETKDDMLSELRVLEAEVQAMLRNNGADASGALS